MEEGNERLHYVEVVRHEKGRVHVLGINLSVDSSTSRLCHIIHDAENGEIIEENSFKYRGAISDAPIWVMLSDVLLLSIPTFINGLRSSEKERVRKVRQYFNDMHQFQDANMMDLEKAANGIELYQGAVEGTERVDTGKPEKFIRAKNDFVLRVRALELGADAVAYYQPGSAIGTPVKYKK